MTASSVDSKKSGKSFAIEDEHHMYMLVLAIIRSPEASSRLDLPSVQTV